MGLVEQLGGYENAKAMYAAQLKAGLAPYGYEEALLEYRREHNIFEVGDKVVRLFNNKVYKINKVEDCGSLLIVRYPSPTKPHFTWASPLEIKHAEPQEIKVGYRL